MTITVWKTDERDLFILKLQAERDQLRFENKWLREANKGFGDLNEKLYAALTDMVAGLDAEYGQRVVDINWPLARPAIAKAQPLPPEAFV